MTRAGVHTGPEMTPASPGLAAAARTLAARAWLGLLFWHAAHAPWVLTAARPLAIAGAWRLSPWIRAGTRANAARLLGPASTSRERTAFGRAVVARFFDTMVEVSQNRRRTPEVIRARIARVDGLEGYERARALGRGAILVTAHIGSFETGLAGIGEREPRVHVVFRRDEAALFERLRSEQRRKFGVIEAPVDDGLPTWFGLRDALRRDEVVLLQGDRVMPGQSGVAVPFLGGRLRVPTGAVKLARATGAPIIPVFAPIQPDGKVRILLDEPITLAEDGRGEDGPDVVLLRIVAAIERAVRAYPDQWLMLNRAWCDEPPEEAGP